jgi:hypothetical protein
MAAKPPERADHLRELCKPGICNLTDEQLRLASQFVLQNQDLATPALVDLARDLMLQIQWERDARSRREDARNAEARAEAIHQRQHKLNVILTVFTSVAALGAIVSGVAGFASWHEQHQQNFLAVRRQNEPQVSSHDLQAVQHQLQEFGSLVLKIDTRVAGLESPPQAAEPKNKSVPPLVPIQPAPSQFPGGSSADQSGTDKLPPSPPAPPVPAPTK